MKKIILSAVITISLANPLLAQSETKDFQIVAYNDCAVSFQQILTPEQTEKYLALKQHEKKMKFKEAPLSVFETQMSELGEQMEAISALAYQEDEETIKINKSFMKDQESIAEQMQQLVKQYQPELDQIEKFANEISQSATEFEASLPTEITEGDYDFVQIIPANEVPDTERCSNHHTYIVR